MVQPRTIPCPGSGCDRRIRRPADGESVICECGQVVRGPELPAKVNGPQVHPTYWQAAPCPKCGQHFWATPWEPMAVCCGKPVLVVEVYLPTNPGGANGFKEMVKRHQGDDR